MDFLDRPWRSFSFNDHGRGDICDSRLNRNLFDVCSLEHQKQHGRRCARQQDRHPARQPATCPFPDRRIEVRDECAAHFCIGIDAPPAWQTVSNVPHHIRGFVVWKLAIHPCNQPS